MRKFFNISIIICLFQAFILSAASCSKKDHEEQPDTVLNKTGIHETLERGPASLTLDIDKKEISIADRINLSITVEIDEEYSVTLPSFGENLEQFGIVDYHTSPPALAGEKRKKISRSYLLEPFLSGEYHIPSMKVSFQKEGEEAIHEIETPEVSIRVNSLLPDDIDNLKLNDIMPPQPLPRSGKYLIIGAGIALAIIIIAGLAVFMLRRNKKSNSGVITLKAHEIAYNEIRLLTEEGLIDKGEIKLFYQRLSGILRRYIETRFGLRAPEQTTEEFLSGLDTAGDFPEKYKPLLRTFLTHCDLVKFAKHEPLKEDIQNSYDSCIAFIQGTKEED